MWWRALFAAVVTLATVQSVGAADDSASTPAAAADAPTFDIFEYRVLGNTVLDARLIERATYPHLGPGRTFDDVQRARDDLAAVYADAGYGTVVVEIPEQAVADGIVRLQIMEGRIGRVRASGARYSSSRQLLDELPELQPGSVPDLQEFQRQLAVAQQRSRDRQITPVLKSGAQPGQVDVELRVKDELPLHASVEVNDRYTADTTRTRLSVNLGYDAMFRRPHSFSLQYQTAPEEPDEARVIAATYVARNPATGRALAFYAVDSDSDVATVGTLAVLGKGTIIGARYLLPLRATPTSTLGLGLGTDYKDFDETVQVDAETSLVTPISYVNWSVTASGSHLRERWRASWNVGPRFGLRGLFNGSDEFSDKRYLGEASYLYVAGDGLYSRALLDDLQLQFRLAGQYSPTPLVSNEQFSFGGATSVRGYLEAEYLADYGAAAGIELQSAVLQRWLGDGFQQFSVFGFIDAGVGALQDPLPGQDRSFDLASAGVGLRLVALESLEADISWAYPFVDGARTFAGDQRALFLVRYGF